jgi:hypothetical protein
MFFTKLRNLAQAIGFITMSLLLLYGAISFFTRADYALGAPAAQATGSGEPVPPYLNFQGTLRDAEGKLISGVHKLTFRIYADVTDPLPEALWMEVHNEVTVRNGHFSVLLGDSQPISPTIFQSPDRFIGITLATLDEMVPRQRFASVPYAFQADNADMVDGLQGQDLALVGHTHNLLRAPDGDPSEALFVNNDGNIGIGTTNPESKLHVVGSILRVSSDFRAIDLRTDGGAVDLVAPNTDLYISSQGGNRNVILNHTGGNVGVNTVAPLTTLDVNGNTHIQGALNFGPGYKPPVLIRRYDDLGEDSTIVIEGISPSEYTCTLGSWSILMDVDEDNEGPYTMWTYVEGEEPFWTWMLRTRHWTDAADRSKADVICFSNGL